ncbi:hypothetical protein [Cellulomonas chengniuliangii]|uniref:Type 4 fimbrial biogenesis protein PilX N-terminal domain-containing protein n=1 Tax=Cellulomonas chengniuliangii TaxID=2968084 RepID=A0ABY5L1V4_9CELL|nr:hypothetical protein [Cellulomonas chengniuliangii]MCC2308409.1 hypothetical protein [Cellulomonas chengniuliangii]UUI76786.1 hypothetical protein NP064_07915 [Cellulomonas chengniuliangii]
MISRIRRARAQEPESGLAMIMVIGISAILAIFMVAAIAFSVGSHRSARSTQDWNSALAAAYAGIEEYQSRLANDTTYFQYGNPAATFEPASDVTLPTGASTNPAFGVGAGGTWADVAGSNGKASFRYEVDNSKYYADGTLRLRSTGMAGGETRTIVADLKQQGFIDFLYFTDYEIQDPEISGASVSTCVKYGWAGRPTSGCSEIAFGSGDTIKGPLHSNDTLRICQATFQGPVTTSYNPPAGLKYLKQDSNGSGCSGQSLLTGYPAYSPVIAMPPTNSQIKREVRSDRPGDVPRPGCLYTGPTTIKFNSNGTMTVRSPWTKFTNVKNDTPGPSDGSLNPDCGTPGTGANQLGSAGGQTLTVPENNVIFVQNVPTSTTDPNYRSGTPSGLSVSSGANGSNGLGYPMSQETTPKGATSTRPAYGFKNGDVFVQGTLKGRVTVAAENYIYVTDDVKYGDSSRDILGLIGNNAVWVWNPVKNSTKLLSGSNRRIDAAILSVAHTFQVQNYDTGGDRGTLTVNGAIAQKFRGIVRSGSHGYKKDYNYDNRFRYTAPPKFLSPVTTTYGVNVWVEVSPVMDSDGTYR